MAGAVREVVGESALGHHAAGGVVHLGATHAAQGRKLVEEKGCEGCHVRKVAGPGRIYTRDDRRATTWPKVKSMVQACNSELNLQLFPDEEEHVAEYLNQAYYKYRK